MGRINQQSTGRQLRKLPARWLYGYLYCLLVGLLCQSCDSLRIHGSIVDANVVDQAGEESARIEIAAGAKVQAAT